MDLKQLAKDTAILYSQNSKVDAVLLGGSVARGWCDAFSDIELFVLWKKEPTNDDRKAPIHKVNGKIIDFYPYEEEEWSESYIANGGVKLEISNFLTSTLFKVIDDVTVKAQISFDKQCLVATIQDGLALTGTQIIEHLKEKIKPYPDELREAMIKENMELGNRWNNREALLNREDWLMLYKLLVEVEMKIMALLFGLNRIYVHHPAFKWQKRSLDFMDIVPYRAAERLNEILLNHPKDGIGELELMIKDTFNLVINEDVNVELVEKINRSEFLRPKHT